MTEKQRKRFVVRFGLRMLMIAVLSAACFFGGWRANESYREFYTSREIPKQLTVFWLKYLDAKAAGNLVKQEFGAANCVAPTGPTRPNKRIVMTVDGRVNALYISANRRDLETIREILTLADGQTLASSAPMNDPQAPSSFLKH